MQVRALGLPGVLLIEHKVFEDARGFFFESWNERAFAAAGIHASFVQENVSESRAYVLRGLHYQVSPHAQGKLLRVLSGGIFDVVVDLRRSSPSFGRSLSISLDAAGGRSLWVPAGFAHGFLAVEPATRMQYLVTDFWSPAHERSLAWNDPRLGIEWPLPPGVSPRLTDKDAAAPPLGQVETFP